MIWDKLVENSNELCSLFDKHFERVEFEKSDFDFEGWTDLFWSSKHIRKCHLKIIDRREDKKLWLMHINIFPRNGVHLPILGYDIVSGPGKITGAFFDYSTPFDHPYSDYLEMSTKSLEWKKERDVPDWGKPIFSSDLIAAGNIREGRELEQLLDVTMDLTKTYVENIDKNAFEISLDCIEYQNLYCQQQKKNPHLHRSILGLGISEEDKDRYVNEVLFEEI